MALRRRSARGKYFAPRARETRPGLPTAPACRSSSVGPCGGALRRVFVGAGADLAARRYTGARSGVPPAFAAAGRRAALRCGRPSSRRANFFARGCASTGRRVLEAGPPAGLRRVPPSRRASGLRAQEPDGAPGRLLLPAKLRPSPPRPPAGRADHRRAPAPSRAAA